MTVHDSHCHFFSRRFFEALGREKYGADRAASAEVVAGELGWEAPGEPEALARRWVDELSRHHVSRAALMASVPGDEESVARAVAAHPDRFVGFFVVNPASPQTGWSTRSGRSPRSACAAPACSRRCIAIGWTMSGWSGSSSWRRRIAAPSSRTVGTCRSRRASAWACRTVLDLRCGDPAGAGRHGRGVPERAGHRAALRRRLLPRGPDGRRSLSLDPLRHVELQLLDQVRAGPDAHRRVPPGDSRRGAGPDSVRVRLVLLPAGGGAR